MRTGWFPIHTEARTYIMLKKKCLKKLFQKLKTLILWFSDRTDSKYVLLLL